MRLRTPKGVPEVPDERAALTRSLETSATPQLVPSLRQWLETRYRGGDVAIVKCERMQELVFGLVEVAEFKVRLAEVPVILCDLRDVADDRS